ncbi:hypothetical protein P153DRAFT_391200 [Dothidotthia symphoricarpi CBS 119687]|uniref:Uncharacterized protein n=1 Tax=Dothidotthia symphoricarpi CBS 119687 TaxID=1392245 RepID=A0A6A5ZW14_9PLEO|nr:uncharacterized protein P153DRAFT_391200 [Dothidotthia symphoricarpi CBS 119687]KAF2123780.1 hypothetical protein P153DRAFT_391200 [Dothidotthia symphoricarpi CBS 119687]
MLQYIPPTTLFSSQQPLQQVDKAPELNAEQPQQDREVNTSFAVQYASSPYLTRSDNRSAASTFENGAREYAEKVTRTGGYTPEGLGWIEKTRMEEMDWKWAKDPLVSSDMTWKREYETMKHSLDEIAHEQDGGNVLTKGVAVHKKVLRGKDEQTEELQIQLLEMHETHEVMKLLHDTSQTMTALST